MERYPGRDETQRLELCLDVHPINVHLHLHIHDESGLATTAVKLAGLDAKIADSNAVLKEAVETAEGTTDAQ